MRAPWNRAAALVVVLVLAAVVAGEAAATQPSGDWLSYGRNGQLTNYVPPFTGLRAVPQDLAWSAQLDGPVYASPLAVAGVSTSTGVRNLILVETEAGSLYALDAADGTIIWQRSFGATKTAGCGTWGTTSTGVVDKQGGYVYVATADGMLHSLALGTGAERPGWPVTITSRPLAEYVWGGLKLMDQHVYVPVASYCDVPDPEEGLAEGRLVAIDTATGVASYEFDPVSGGDQLGGIWGVGGVSSDEGGDTLYTATGNAEVHDPGCNCTVETVGYADDVVALTPDLSSVVAYDRPPYIPTVGDSDFGAAPLVFQPKGCPPLLAANNKNGNLFVWNRSKISTGPIARFGLSDSIAPFIAEPSWDPVTQTMYDAEASVKVQGKVVGEGVAAIAVGPACSFKESWLANIGTGVQMPPIVVGDTVFDGGGDVRTIVGLDATTGKLVWHWHAPGSASVTAPLIDADDLLIAADTAGVVRAFH
jgi:outer membrane protein assembly factor BamB